MSGRSQSGRSVRTGAGVPGTGRSGQSVASYPSTRPDGPGDSNATIKYTDAEMDAMRRSYLAEQRRKEGLPTISEVEKADAVSLALGTTGSGGPVDTDGDSVMPEPTTRHPTPAPRSGETVFSDFRPRNRVPSSGASEVSFGPVAPGGPDMVPQVLNAITKAVKDSKDTGDPNLLLDHTARRTLFATVPKYIEAIALLGETIQKLTHDTAVRKSRHVAFEIIRLMHAVASGTDPAEIKADKSAEPYRDQYTKVANMVRIMWNQLNEAKSQAQTLLTAKAASDAAVAERDTAILQNSATIQRLTTELKAVAASSGDVAGVQAILEVRDSKILNLQTALTELTRNVEARDARVLDLEVKLNTMTEEKATWMSDRQGLQRVVKLRDETIADMKHQIGNLDYALSVAKGDPSAGQLMSQDDVKAMNDQKQKQREQEQTIQDLAKQRNDLAAFKPAALALNDGSKASLKAMEEDKRVPAAILDAIVIIPNDLTLAQLQQPGGVFDTIRKDSVVVRRSALLTFVEESAKDHVKLEQQYNKLLDQKSTGAQQQSLTASPDEFLLPFKTLENRRAEEGRELVLVSAPRTVTVDRDAVQKFVIDQVDAAQEATRRREEKAATELARKIREDAKARMTEAERDAASALERAKRETEEEHRLAVVAQAEAERLLAQTEAQTKELADLKTQTDLKQAELKTRSEELLAAQQAAAEAKEEAAVAEKRAFESLAELDAAINALNGLPRVPTDSKAVDISSKLKAEVERLNKYSNALRDQNAELIKVVNKGEEMAVKFEAQVARTGVYHEALLDAFENWYALYTYFEAYHGLTARLIAKETRNQLPEPSVMRTHVQRQLDILLGNAEVPTLAGAPMQELADLATLQKHVDDLTQKATSIEAPKNLVLAIEQANTKLLEYKTKESKALMLYQSKRKPEKPSSILKRHDMTPAGDVGKLPKVAKPQPLPPSMVSAQEVKTKLQQNEYKRPSFDIMVAGKPRTRAIRARDTDSDTEEEEEEEEAVVEQDTADFVLVSAFTAMAVSNYESFIDVHDWIDAGDWDLEKLADRSDLTVESPHLKWGNLLTDVSESFVLRTRVLPVIAVVEGLRCADYDELLRNRLYMPPLGEVKKVSQLIEWLAGSQAAARMRIAQLTAAMTYLDVDEGRICLDDCIPKDILRLTEVLIECETAAREFMVHNAVFKKHPQRGDELLLAIVHLSSLIANMHEYVLAGKDDRGYLPLLMTKWRRTFDTWSTKLVSESSPAWQRALAEYMPGKDLPRDIEPTQPVLAIVYMSDLEAELGKST